MKPQDTQRELLFRLMKETDGIWEDVGRMKIEEGRILYCFNDEDNWFPSELPIPFDRADQFVMMVGDERLFERDVISITYYTGYEEINGEYEDVLETVDVVVRFNEYHEIKAYYPNGKKWDNEEEYDAYSDKFYCEYSNIKNLNIIGIEGCKNDK
jgi:hypothetical protein